MFLIGGCGWLPADPPATTPAPPHADAPLLHDWKIAGHVLGTRALISDYDAAEFDGRTVSVTDGGYASPWSGRCEQSTRQKAPRAVAEVALEHDVAVAQADRLALGTPVVEYQLRCATGSAPGMIVYVGGAHAVTCFAGVCYLLVR